MQEFKFNNREDAGILHDRDKTNCWSHTPISNPSQETRHVRLFRFVEANLSLQDRTSRNALGLTLMSPFLIGGKAQTRSPSAGDSEVVPSHHMKVGLALTGKENFLEGFPPPITFDSRVTRVCFYVNPSFLRANRSPWVNSNPVIPTISPAPVIIHHSAFVMTVRIIFREADASRVASQVSTVVGIRHLIVIIIVVIVCPASSR